MHTAHLAHEADVAGWRAAARRAIAAGIAPENVIWTVGGAATDLFAAPAVAHIASPFTVPRRFVDLAEDALLHRNPDRFGVMYRLLSRVRSTPALLDDAADPDVRCAELMAKAVHRDIHKMHAFVRFKEVAGDDGPVFLSWFEPSHHTLEAGATFFVDRFAAMHWAIFTPERSAHWDGATLAFGPGATRAIVPATDRLDDHWRAYYRSIFNPARVKIKTMTKEMPKKYWRNLPETADVTPLLRAAASRSATMVAAAPTVTAPMAMVEARRRGTPPQPVADFTTLSGLRHAADTCRRCPLGALATQCVFGEGPHTAALMIVGEQPGDQEDLAGKPFVGPAGRVLDSALAHAKIDRAQAYVTNAVKHFKFEPRGKRRMHKTPSAQEVDHCRWWLDRERALVKPKTIIALGATAARSVLGRAVTIADVRGRAIPLADGSHAWVTVHPSYLLRLPDAAARDAETQRFIDDLTRVARTDLHTRAGGAQTAAASCAPTMVLKQGPHIA